MTESAIQTSIVKYLNNLGYLVVKNITVSMNGWPDLTAIAPNGDHLYIEVKTDTGRLSPVQKVRHEQLKQHNVPVITVTTLKEVKSYVEKVS